MFIECLQSISWEREIKPIRQAGRSYRLSPKPLFGVDGGHTKLSNWRQLGIKEKQGARDR